MKKTPSHQTQSSIHAVSEQNCCEYKGFEKYECYAELVGHGFYIA